MTTTILHGNCLDVLKTLPDNSVHMAVTSPPYWGLRAYGTEGQVWPSPDGTPLCQGEHEWLTTRYYTENTLAASSAGAFSEPGAANAERLKQGRWRENNTCSRCGAWRGELGHEPTPQLYVAHLVQIMREVRRVLRDDGTLWLNIGDSYAGGKGASSQAWSTEHQDRDTLQKAQHQIAGKGETRALDDRAMLAASGLKPKDLVGIPWRVAFALQDDGWWLRQDIIWCLSGGTTVYARTQKGDMPMTVKDAARLDPSTVQLWNGEKWTQVRGWSKSKRRGDEIEIVLRSGERISCTPTHRFPTARGLLAASEIVPGDVLQSTHLPEPEQPKDSQHVGLDAAWLAGLYIAEGSRSQGTIQITGHARESARLARVKAIAEAYGGSATVSTQGNTQNIRVYGKVLNALIDQLVSGHTAKDKSLAPVCWRYSNAFLRSILDGYLSGDGAWDEQNHRWRLGFTRNYNLERDLRTLAARLGLALTLNLASVKYNGTQRPTFRGEIRFNGNNKSDKCEVVEVRKARCREVYDVGVADEPHLFALASGVLTHNSKPNPMPESVTDRCTKAHEYMFLLAKSARYYYDAEAVKEPNSESSGKWGRSTPSKTAKAQGNGRHGKTSVLGSEISHEEVVDKYYTNGRNRRSVWTITTKPFREAHFATFPPDLVEPCIKAGTSQHGVCATCGAPWERIVERGLTAHDGETKTLYAEGTTASRLAMLRQAARQRGAEYANSATTTGWRPTCTCNADTTPATVLDPFNGAGTTGVVAKSLGRDYIGIELNPAYIEMAQRRIDNTQPPLL